MSAEPHRKSAGAAAPASARPTAARAHASATTLGAALLVLAVALGAWLRLDALGAREMSADEGASWVAAAASNLAAVARVQRAANPGKLAVYELALHGWIAVFGDGLGPMRSLSALLDTVSIVVVFALTRELLGPPRRIGDAEAPAAQPAGLESAEAGVVAALAALLFAVDLVTIKYARELRMYPLALLVVLLQAWTFIRAARRARPFDLALLAILTALAAAAHFAAGLMVAAEVLWLIAVAPGLRAMRTPRGRASLAAAIALGAGAALFVLVAWPALRTGAGAFAHGATGWIGRPRWWAPVALFNKGAGTFAFPPMAALAAWGAWRGWTRARGAVCFALSWMWLPPLMLLAGSYAFAPMFVERYALWCFVPFFILAALGAWELGRAPLRAAAVALMVALALAHIQAYRRRPRDTQWREAARAAAAESAPGARVAVVPPFAVNVVRYYLRGADVRAATARGGQADTAVLIAGDRWHADEKTEKLLGQYPRLIAGLRGVRVVGRAAPGATAAPSSGEQP